MGMTEADRAALDALPKVDLHCHIEGTMRPQTVVELADRNDRQLPTRDPTELYAYTSLDTFLDVFWLVQSMLATRDDWAQLAHEAVIDQAASGLAYGEFFFTPARHLDAGQDLADIVAGLDEGLTAGEQETGARVALIADMDRAFGATAADELMARLVELRRAGATGTGRIIGVGMDSTEHDVDPADYAAAYRAAASVGLHRTAHQGETMPPWTIRTALDVLGCERIDHGLTILDDADLTRRMADERTPLTVCPSSNVLIANHVDRLALHPYPRMRDAGLLATVNTDDPALTDLTLAGEYRAVADAFDYDLDDMVAIALDGIDATWLDDDERRKLRSRVRDTLRRHRHAT